MLFSLILAVALTSLASVSRARLRVGVVETKDPYTHLAGLAKLVRRSGHRAIGVTKTLRRGRLPLRRLDTLVVGSFVAHDERVWRGLDEQATSLAAWIATGHTLIVLAQEDRDVRDRDLDMATAAAWLPEPLRLAWGNRDGDGLHPRTANHRLFREPNTIGREQLLGWQFRPGGGDRSVLLQGVHDAFRTVSGGFAVVATADPEGRHPALVVGTHGRGRVIGLAVPVDKIAASPREPAHGQAIRSLFENLLAYAETALRHPDRIGEETPSEPVHLRPTRRRVFVFEDRDDDGEQDDGEPALPGILVGHDLARYRTDDAGVAAISVDPADPRWLHVQVPSAWRLRDGRLFVRDDSGHDFVFPLVRREEIPRSFHVAQVTDWHIGRRAIRSEAIQGLVAGFARLRPRIDFVLATGDLTQRGSPEEIAAYREHVARSGVPVLPVMGNHDASRGPERGCFYSEQIGPVFYGFEHGGLHFTVAYVASAGTPEMDWIRADLTESGLPSVLVLHHLPRTRLLAALRDTGLVAVVHGHWHGNRVVSYAGRPVVSTSSALMGGWDHSPASFRLLSFEAGALTGSELRYTGADRFAAIVVPAEATADSARRLIVHAHDAFRPPTGGVAEIRVEPGSGDRAGPIRVELVRAGPLTWTADLGGLAPGDYTIEVTLRDAVEAWPPLRRAARLVAPAPNADAPTGEWTTYRHDARRSGSTKATLRPPLVLRWTAALGGAVHHASPVVDGERVYVAVEDRNGLPLDALASRVVALDRRSGRTLWSHPTRSSVRHSPTLHRGLLYFQQENGDVTALEAATGRPRWHFELDAVFPPRYGGHWASCAPLAYRNRLVACYHRHPVVLAADSGRLIETLPAQGREDAFTLSAAAYRRGVLYLGGLFTGVSAYRWGRDGEARTLWRHRSKGLDTTPVATSAGVWVQDVVSVLRRDPGSGAEQALVALRGARSPVSPLILPGGDVVVGDRAGRLVRWSVGSGKRVWSLRTGAARFSQTVNAPPGTPSISSAPALARRTVWFGADDGRLRAVRVRDGRVLWERDLGLPITGGPAITGDDLYVADLGGVLFAFSSAR